MLYLLILFLFNFVVKGCSCSSFVSVRVSAFTRLDTNNPEFMKTESFLMASVCLLFFVIVFIFKLLIHFL